VLKSVTIDERLDRLTNFVDALASSVVAHANQIDALIKVADKSSAQMADLDRRW